MPRIRLIISLVLFAFAGGTAAANTMIIDHVTVVTPNSEGSGFMKLEDARVTVMDGRITAVDKAAGTVGLRHGVGYINGKGKFLFPGLTEMHGHLPFRSGGDEAAADTLFLYLAGGVTTVRGMLGEDYQFELREKVASSAVWGPTMYLAAPSLNGNSVSSPDEARALVRQHHSDGYDLIKIHPGLTLDEYKAAAEEARALGIHFGGHVPADVGLETALSEGQISLDHMDGTLEWLYGEEGRTTDDLVALLKSRDIWVVPTQALFNLLYGGGDLPALKAHSENQYVSPETRQTWEDAVNRINQTADPKVAKTRDAILKAITEGGVAIVMGSDAPQIFSVPGFSIWREIEAMQTAGLTNDQILLSATVAPGRYFADKDRFGSIATGQRADLLLLDADPTQDISTLQRIEGVMTAGRWLSARVMKQKLQAIAAKHQDP